MAKLNLLIVDDEPGIRSGIKRILLGFCVDFPFLEEEFDFNILEAASGEEAIDIIDKNAIDIVLLDNKLPGIDGIEVLEYINKKQYDCNVMMITSYASLDLAIKATNNGAYNFVPKPFTPQELKTSIEGITKNLYLRRMTKQLNTVGKQIRFQFLSVLSHELKSPINAIEGYLRIMEERQVGNNLDDYEMMIQRSLERIKGMRTLIMDMLDLTRLESGKKARDVKKLNLVSLLKISRDTMSPMAIQKNVKIFINAEPNEIYYLADQQEIEIIFNNLVSNAVKYNKDNGEVNCVMREDEHSITISVSDTGIGMSEEDMSRLFQEFTRIKNEKTKGISGSGLGLSIMKKIVEDVYSGTVTVSSKEDEGSTFTVVLPKINIVV
ncbi:MAG: ATP-binding protein [Bacteroidales bacterium]|jgi:signal transduction histidine kinase|nr:ATP-binding protein [Bacteroidales bacterium]MDD3691126.1 ATP-binding protein [Bacteroidales bacterium]MDD4044770.1 ATP-binding protein [Bacteroidales bacterium]NLO42464.1 response regulator [Bacteroidales bacterium]